MLDLKVEDFGLVHAIYPMGTMKFNMTGLRAAKVPKICPHCLKPGTMQQYFGPFVVGIWRLSIPLSTHPECSQGFRKRNISGSTRVWTEGEYICFKFENPVYAMLFSRINFNILRDGRGRPLTEIYQDELRDLRKKQESRKNIVGTCPRCNNDLYADLSECPSCKLSRRQTWTRMEPTHEVIETNIDPEKTMSCPICEITMLKEKDVKTCANCGSSL